MLSHQLALYCASAFCLIPARLPSPVLLFLDSPSPSGLSASLSPLASDPLASTLIWLSYSHSAPSLLGTCPNQFQLLPCALITAYDVVLCYLTHSSFDILCYHPDHHYARLLSPVSKKYECCHSTQNLS